MRLTYAITHIGLTDANTGKLAQLDALAATYMQLCQAYVTAFCTDGEPNKFSDTWLDSPLSARHPEGRRWVVIQHAVGVAQSWCTRRDHAYQAYLDDLAEHPTPTDLQRSAAHWREWTTPTLKQTVIQANANVAVPEPSEDSNFDYWLCVSTLDKDQPIRIPVKLAAYHQQILAGGMPNASMTLTRKLSGWWLTLTVDETVASTTTADSPKGGDDGAGTDHGEYPI
jgi:hypothetical protein